MWRAAHLQAGAFLADQLNAPRQPGAHLGHQQLSQQSATFSWISVLQHSCEDHPVRKNERSVCIIGLSQFE